MRKWIPIAIMLLSGCIEQTPQEEPTTTVTDCTGRDLGAHDVRESPPSAFIFAGQSNMAGIDDGSSPAIEGAVVWVDNHWETYAPTCSGPELAFIQAWTRDNPGSTIGIVKLAAGGSSMGDWQVNWRLEEATTTYGPLYAELVAMYRAAGVPVGGIIWAQGETDTVFSDLAARYEGRLQEFVAALRSEVGERTPFVLAETSMPTEYFGQPVLYLATIQTAQYGLTFWDAVHMAPTGDLPTYEDGVHFTREGRATLGDRLYSAYRTAGTGA